MKKSIIGLLLFLSSILSNHAMEEDRAKFIHIKAIDGNIVTIALKQAREIGFFGGFNKFKDDQEDIIDISNVSTSKALNLTSDVLNSFFAFDADHKKKLNTNELVHFCEIAIFFNCKDSTLRKLASRLEKYVPTKRASSNGEVKKFCTNI